MDKAKRKLPPAPPVDNGYQFDETPFRTAAEARRDARAGASLAQGLKEGAVRLSLWAFWWVERGGADLVGVEQPQPTPPPGVNLKPMSDHDLGILWVSRELGMRSSGHVRKLARLGAVRTAISANVNFPRHVLDALPEMALEPLTELLPADRGTDVRPDRSEKIAPAFMAAVEEADTDDKPVSKRHTRAAVNTILGRKPPPELTAEQRIAKAITDLLPRIRKLDADVAIEVEKHLERACQALGAEI